MDGSPRPARAPVDPSLTDLELALRAAPAARGASHVSRGARPGPVVLIADDDQDAPLILQRRLAHHGYATLVASSGDAALMLARSLHPAALVSELYLAAGDCPCLVHAVRRDPALRHLPVLVYTTFVLPADERWAAQAQVDVFVRKPAPPSEVAAVVEWLAGPPHRTRHA